MIKKELSPARVYCMRHQEAEKHADGRRNYAAGLSNKGKADARVLVPYLANLDLAEVWVGSLPRHQETLYILKEGLNSNATIRTDNRLDAIPRSSFLEQDPREVEKTYSLARFATNQGELYQGQDSQGAIRFNPQTLGIFPFDPFICRVHLNERLRNLVFPQDRTLESTRQDISALHDDLRDTARAGDTVATIGSGSVNRILREYAEHGTVGEHLFDYEAKEKRPFFSQRADHLIILGTGNQKSDRLKVINQDISIKDLSGGHND